LTIGLAAIPFSDRLFGYRDLVRSAPDEVAMWVLENAANQPIVGAGVAVIVTWLGCPMCWTETPELGHLSSGTRSAPQPTFAS
jgi:hypothetical protein